ncbi:HEAT repeat domain-containing protein [Haliangium sp.]|uniref:HEAT repeat domain-containing protein n=1 Tax=Haliangium sp. TaxID=2663208 RepID=UPI003D09E0F5
MMRLRFLSLLVPLLLMLSPGRARADAVDRLITQLRKSSDYKVRLSAALNLGKRGDQRAVSALVDALGDDNKNVRGAAVTALSKLVGGDTDERMRKRALAALQRLAKRDPDGFVRKQAGRAVDEIKALDSPQPQAGGIYVNIGQMSSKTQVPSKLIGLMRQTTTQTFSKQASSMATSWPSGGAPSAKQLRASKTTGYHVDGTLVALQAQSQGDTTLVSCKVSMLIATYPEKSMFGFLDGGARVQTGSSSRDIAYAQEDCVSAVVEDLVTRKIIPVIQQRH